MGSYCTPPGIVSALVKYMRASAIQASTCTYSCCTITSGATVLVVRILDALQTVFNSVGDFIERMTDFDKGTDPAAGKRSHEMNEIRVF
jgi:hypothetical protein